METWVSVVPLGPTHPIEDFCCGEPAVDEWLHVKARNSGHLVSTFVCLDSAGAVRAFFALKTVIVDVEGLSSALRRGSEGDRSVGILLCQMGLAQEDRGQGTGAALLSLAMGEAMKAHTSSPVPLLVVDAANENLVAYYQRAGFKRIPNTLRLLMPMSTVRRLLG